MKYRPAEILVGAFVLAGFAVILAAIFLIHGVGLRSRVTYHALYANVAGIEDGTPVKYNGMLVGRVDGLKIDDEDRTKVRVTFAVREGTPVTARTVAKITKADILGDPYVDLHQLESQAPGSARLDEPGDILPQGSRILAGEPFDLQATLDDAAAAIESLSALAALVKRQVEAVIDDVRKVLQTAQRLLSDENRARIEETLARLADTSRGMQSLVADNRERLDGVIRSAQMTADSFRNASAQIDESLDRILPKAEILLDSTDRAVTDLRGLVVSAKGTLSAFDVQRINDLLDNLDSTTRNLAEFSRDLKDRPYRLIRPEKHDAQPERLGP